MAFGFLIFVLTFSCFLYFEQSGQIQYLVAGTGKCSAKLPNPEVSDTTKAASSNLLAT